MTPVLRAQGTCDKLRRYIQKHTFTTCCSVSSVELCEFDWGVLLVDCESSIQGNFPPTLPTACLGYGWGWVLGHHLSFTAFGLCYRVIVESSALPRETGSSPLCVCVCVRLSAFEVLTSSV